jgi:hypothetical protein
LGMGMTDSDDVWQARYVSTFTVQEISQ